MENLGEDLLLLAIEADHGNLFKGRFLQCGLMGSELARLAALGRIDITGDAITVRDLSPTGDAELDLALESLAQSGEAPQARTWVGRPRSGIIDQYLARLTNSGVVRTEQRQNRLRIKHTVLVITDSSRYANARAALDAIAAGGPIDVSGAALAGLAHAAGVVGSLYPGRENRDVRSRFEQLANGTRSGRAVVAAQGDVDDPAEPSMDPLTATRLATDAAMLAAADAATHAAVLAATEAAVHAAVHATAHVPADSSSHGGAVEVHHHH